MTKDQIKKFVKTRNESEYLSNMQFQIDAEECGFKAKELGDPINLVNTEHQSLGCVGYRWNTEHGCLIECVGQRPRLVLWQNWEAFKSKYPTIEEAIPISGQ